MKHPLIHAGQLLTTTLLILMGLNTYGCGDTASTSTPAELGNLSVSAGEIQPPFNPATTAYTVRISNNVSSTTISVSPRVSGDAIRIDNEQITNKTVTLTTPGAKTTVSIVVTDTGTGGTSKLYSVEVIRDEEDSSLVALSVSTGDLGPEFDKDTFDYTVNNVGPSFTKITISATKSDPNAVMEIGSVTIPAGPASGQADVKLGGTGSATEVPIVVTAKGGGSKRTYKVTINRGPSDNAFLGSLSVSSAKLDFKPKSTVYNVSVASSIEKVTVTAKPQDSTASITINGSATNPQSIPLPAPGAPPVKIAIHVTAQNGNSRDYEVNVKRAALNGNNKLKSLTASPGNLTFDPDDLSYNLNLSSTETSVKITAAPQDGNASVTINGQPSPNTINLGASGPQTQVTIPIIVTAQNNDTRKYEVTVIRAALGGNNNLSALSVTADGVVQVLDPKADPTTYTVNVASTVGTVDISATKDDPTAVMSGDVTAGAGQKTGTNTITLSGPGTKNVVLITVTAPNSSAKIYRINVNQAALGSNNNLKKLTLSSGSLSPKLNANQTSYTANVGSGVTSVTVTATLEDPAASLTIDGQGTNSGVASAPITLGEPGSSTDILIVVVAPNEDSKSYTITVKKRPPAPDLIDEDDSCPLLEPPDPADPNKCAPGTSRVDNVTTVTSPGFRITQPGSPSLYIDDVKVDSIDQGANVLKPVSPLSDGTHTITYTVTNEANLESPRSDSLKVTIDTGGIKPPNK